MVNPLAPPPAVAVEHSPASELAALAMFLDIQRLEFHERAWGLSAQQLHRTVASSDLTLGGLVKHMALIEHSWFEYRFAGSERREPWASAPWDQDPDWEFHTAADDTVDELFTLFVDACGRSREIITASTSGDQHSIHVDDNGRHWNLRWIMIHMVEEYARHLGHADIIRESIDGTRG